MLALDSPRWSELTTFFGSPEDAPSILREWLDAIGSDSERDIYSRDLFDLYLHQVTITNVAFAIVPWIVMVCRERPTRHRGDYLVDVALVEMNRLVHGVYCNRPGTDPMPSWLMNDYADAITLALPLVEEVLLDEPLDAEVRSYLKRVEPALYGNAKLAWANWLNDDTAS